ncbi:hypothetical protein KVV02_002544 [Mortierella alpina]|uniref:F-box domain-containing protein n=1 Tax=Mortierella alpina TaxID=64518 RepID=A0A9P8CYD6_MORAP|nr:hypothetical protein KVV02_002544 [Mortierella alpina]
MIFDEPCKCTLEEDRGALKRVLDIAELWSNIIAFLSSRQIRRLRLVSKRMYNACSPHYCIHFPLDSRTPGSLTTEPDFPADLITAVQIEGIDQISQLISSTFEKCSRLTVLKLYDFGLDVSFLDELLRLCPAQLQCLFIRSEGFVSLDSMTEVLLSAAVAPRLHTLGLEIGDTGLEGTHSMPWTSFRFILDTYASLSSLSLGRIEVMDIPASLEEVNALHATTMAFPNIKELSLIQCCISGTGRARLLRMFPNLMTLRIVCRDAVFEPSRDGERLLALPDHEARVTDLDLGTQITRVRIECTNLRSHADQRGLFQFLGHLPSLKILELSGLVTSREVLMDLAESWCQRNVQLKQLVLDSTGRRAPDDESLELILRMPCFSRLEGLDAWCGPNLLLRFWNKAMRRSEIPCLSQLRALHLRKGQGTEDLQEGALEALNLTLKQMPRLVDLTLAVRLEDFAVFQDMGRDPYGTSLEGMDGAGSVVSVETSDWSQERPFLQSLGMGCSLGFFQDRIDEVPRQIGRRFRFLEDFEIILGK